MGFYINEDEIELKQHLNLSENAWFVVHEDIRNFYIEEYKQNFSGFLNKIIANFYQTADASISLRVMEVNEKYKKIFESSTTDSNNNEKYLKILLDSYIKETVKKNHSYLKGSGEKFRINKSNLEMLRDSSDVLYYNDSIGTYIKALIEEYALKQNYQRERIFFKDIIDEIQTAILRKNKLKISLMQQYSADGKSVFTSKYYVSPYEIRQDKSNNYNYLLGFAEEILPDGNIGDKKFASFRLSRIAKANIMSSMSGFISKTNKEIIEKEITSKGIQFLLGGIIDIKIRFSDLGVETFNRKIYNRPTYYDIIEKNVYQFHCTEFHAMTYFFSFADQIEIIEPLEIREKFKQKYLSALNNYQQ